MTASSNTKSALGTCFGLALLAAGLTACGAEPAVAESRDMYGHTVERNQDLADRVPADWRGGITVPLQVLRPNAFVDEDNNPVGVQPDLIEAMSTKLGIAIKMEVAPFDAQVPGVQANQYAFTTATGDFPERREVLTMVDYTIAGLGWLAAADSEIDTPGDICGHTIGVAKGTNQEVRAEEIVAACEAEDIHGTSFIGFSNTLMTVPLEVDRIDVTYDSISSVLYFAGNEPEKFKMVGDQINDAAIAFGVVAGEQEKAELLRDTLKELKNEGVYESIFNEWGLPSLMLEDIYINSEGLSLD